MLIAVTIASVDVHTNATISESPIATPLHTKGGLFLGSRLLPGIWTSPASPLVISEARRLTADPVAYAEARRLAAHPVAFSEVRLITALPSPPQEGVASRRSLSPTGRRVASRRSLSPTGRRVASRWSPCLLRGSSSHSGPRRLLKGSSPPGVHHQLSEWDSLQSQDLALPGDSFMGICVLQDAPAGTSSLHREVPLRPDEDAMRRETLSPLNCSTHLELRLKSPLKGSIEAYLQDPLITICVVIFASWRKNLLL